LLLEDIQNRSGAQTATYSMDSGASSRVKVAET